MYLSHFRLKEKPFQISPDPRFLWLGKTHKEALARLKFGIHDNRGFLLLVGDVGTGKTTLINGLLESLDEDTIAATIPDPGLEKLDFYNFLTHAFDIEKQFTSKGEFLVHFIHFLHKANSENKRVLIIIDEAQRLDHEMLEEIRQLSNIEKKSTKLLNIFLVGQNELNQTLSENRNRALLQRITTRYSIGPLPANEIEEYVRFRLKVAGCDRTLFTTGAIRQVVAFSNCYPRLINVICDHALLTGFVRGKKKIDAGIVKECAGELSITDEKKTGAGDNSVGIFGTILKSLVFPWRKPIYGAGVYLLLLVFLAGCIIYFRAPALFHDQFSRSPKKTLTKEPSTQFPIKKTPEAAPVKTTSPVVSPKTDKNETTQPGTAASTSQSVSAKPKSPSVSESEIKAHLDKKFIIRFKMDSNEFPDNAYTLMNKLARIITQKPEIVASINGYTDSLGNRDYNRRLSEFRANVVKSYLIGQGVPPDRVRTTGLGPKNPIQSNTTREGRAANRRVEIMLHYEP